MYRNVWEMYRTHNLIEFFKMMKPLDLNLMYIKVVVLEELYLFAENHLHLHELGVE